MQAPKDLRPFVTKKEARGHSPAIRDFSDAGQQKACFQALAAS
jgi:hypothetical protein